MPIIQYALPSKNKQLKKLLHFYWEVLPKHDDQGKLKQEMILVWCVAILSSNYHLHTNICTLVMPFEMTSYVPRLPIASRTSCRRVDFQQHPNEYIRGATLRFLQKIKEPELLEPLIATCRSCLVRTSGSQSSFRIRLIVFLAGTPPLLRPQERSTSRLLNLSLLRTAHPRCARAHADLPRCRIRYNLQTQCVHLPRQLRDFPRQWNGFCPYTIRSWDLKT
jgi:hypothetical protein